MRLCVLSFNVNFQSGLEFHCEVVIPDNDALKPSFYQGFIEGIQVCGLLLDEVLYRSNGCGNCNWLFSKDDPLFWGACFGWNEGIIV